MDTYPRERWIALGAALRARRDALGYGFRDRPRFARDGGIGSRTVQRLEGAARAGFPPETIARAERAYRLPPGSVRRFLDGGPLIPDAPPPPELPPLTPEETRLAAAFIEALRRGVPPEGRGEPAA